MVPTHLQNLATAVYRFFDADGGLLYVGMTSAIGTRFAHHRRTAAWWGAADQVRTQIDWYDTRDEAARAELKSIADEHPRWNRIGTPDFHPGRPKTALAGEKATRVQAVVDLYRQQLALLEEYKSALADVIEQDAVPIAYMAQQLGLQRKTVYRHVGRSMT